MSFIDVTLFVLINLSELLSPWFSDAGPRLRHDDPVALKEIVQMAQANKKEGGETRYQSQFLFWS